MAQIKIAFFDIDGTLYDHRIHKWTPSALAAVKEAQENGVKVFVCTARPFYSLKLFGTLDIGIKWDGIICSAGATVFVGRKLLKNLEFPKHLVEKYLELCERHGLCNEVVATKMLTLSRKPNNFTTLYHETFRDPLMPIRKYDGKPITGFLLFAPREMDHVILDVFPNLTWFRFDDFGVDVSNRPHEKGDAIKDVLDYYGYAKDEAIAVGDERQDLTMKPQVGTFVCVGNGREEVKAQADFVSKPIWEDGVQEALRKYGLIK